MERKKLNDESNEDDDARMSLKILLEYRLYYKKDPDRSLFSFFPVVQPMGINKSKCPSCEISKAPR